MGLLDEAIREHLELKKRAGADAIEVARQEREALGPVVRGDPLTADLPPNQPVYEAAEADRYEPELYDEAEDEFEDDYDEAEDLQTAEHAVVVPPPPPPPPAHYQPATEVLEEPAGGTAEDDVLEQTPEFLQETPEHDRLWFEQAPPKEFDFDK
ncbi:MAG: hypothetical protein QOH12_3913 [Solirubrobacteraceae bacterium]|jgi:hypothetical protein|nr:hypothetical protein [Solirubrobacteraceae bacterium]